MSATFAIQPYVDAHGQEVELYGLILVVDHEARWAMDSVELTRAQAQALAVKAGAGFPGLEAFSELNTDVRNQLVEMAQALAGRPEDPQHRLALVPMQPEAYQGFVALLMSLGLVPGLLAGETNHATDGESFLSLGWTHWPGTDLPALSVTEDSPIVSEAVGGIAWRLVLEVDEVGLIRRHRVLGPRRDLDCPRLFAEWVTELQEVYGEGRGWRVGSEGP